MGQGTSAGLKAENMAVGRQLTFWIVALIVFLLFVFLLNSILLPFVAALAIAYFLDPLADYCERLGMGRTLATTTIVIGFFLVALAAVLLIVPVLTAQVEGFMERWPRYVGAIRNLVEPLMATLHNRFGLNAPPDFQTLAQQYGERVLSVMGGVVGGLVGGGKAVINFLSLFAITPVVAFYLLRDWDRLVHTVDGWLPRAHADVIRQQVRDIDDALAGCVRGQALVCLSLAVFYGAALTLAGLEAGLLIGLVTGLLAFIPFVGAMIGFVLSFGVALAQWWPDYTRIGIVLGIFLIGQILEGYVLTPRLVGSRIGLHPVWVIFALLAGGALFGFVGMLLSLPMFAVVAVLARFALNQYLDSAVYRGGPQP